MSKTKNSDTIQHPLYRYAHLYRRGDVIYTHIRLDGKKYRETTNLTWTSQNFQYALNLIEERIQEIKNPHPDGKPLKDLFESFLTLKSKSVTNSAIKKYRQSWNHWIEYDYTTNEISLLRADIVDLIGKSSLHNNTINKSLQMLSAFFRYLIEIKAIAENPITNSMLPKLKQDEPTQYSEDEINRLINYFEPDSNLNLLIRLVSSTGMRIAEATSLISDNFSDNWITFYGKGKALRQIPILAGSDLEQVILILKKREKAFHWKRYDEAHRQLNIACRKLNIQNKGFHGIRKYFENKLIDSGANIKATADILGHTLQIQSKHYKTKSKSEKLQAAMKLLQQ